jgi:hypothetical protein
MATSCERLGFISRLKRSLLARLPLRLAHLRWLLIEPNIETLWPRRLKYERRPERWLLMYFLRRQDPNGTNPSMRPPPGG